MKKLLVFGASNSKSSINKDFAEHVSGLIIGSHRDIIDLNDFEMPIYSIDRELENGAPKLAHDFKEKIRNCDGIVISLAEHNGTYTSAFKNIFDWISRVDSDSVWCDKPILLLSTSPGERGACTVLATAEMTFSLMSKGKVFSFAFPEYHKNFDSNKGIINKNLAEELSKHINNFSSCIDNTPIFRGHYR